MKNEIINQIKMNGYKVEEVDESVFATRDNTPIIMIKFHDHGVNFYGQFNSNNLSVNDSAGFKSYINELNISSNITSFCTSKDGLFQFTANYLGNYNEYSFAQFIRLWEYDVINLLDDNTKSFMYLGSNEDVAIEYGISNASSSLSAAA